MVYAALTFRLLLAGVFLVSVAAKLRTRRSFDAFAEAVGGLGGVPGGFAGPAAVAVVTAEAGIAVLLAFPGLAAHPGAGRAGFLLAGTLLLGFTAVLAAALLRGAAVPCRCLGASQEPVRWRHVARNAFLIGCAAAGAALTPAAAGVSVAPAAAALCLLGASAAVGAVVLLDDLIYLIR
jgi:hypothetical protein